jgi:N utilization substance protein B
MVPSVGDRMPAFYRTGRRNSTAGRFRYHDGMITRRSRAREVALQLLFQRDLNPKAVPRPAVEQFVRDRLRDDAELTAYCLALYDGVAANAAAIDQTLTATAENWRLSRMLPADRNVLRLGAYELLYDKAGAPLEVVINEAVELARRFGAKDSPGFVNGILDKIARVRNAERVMLNENPPGDQPTPVPDPASS